MLKQMLKLARAVLVAAIVTGAMYQARADGGTTAAAAASAASSWAGERLRANSEGVKNETTVVGKIVKPLGPSVDDIKKHGFPGGSGSVFRKPLGKLFR